jgi:hypothetical protein
MSDWKRAAATVLVYCLLKKKQQNLKKYNEEVVGETFYFKKR